MNEIEKLILLTAKEHERENSAARFFWFVFSVDKWLGVFLVLVLGIALLWSFYAR